MPLYTYLGDLLTNANALAVDAACCCNDCFLLTACNGASPDILTDTDLSAYVTGTVMLDDYICYHVEEAACDGSEVPVTVLSGDITDDCDDCQLGPDCGCCDAGTTPLDLIVNVPLIDTGLDCTGGAAELIGPARVVFTSDPTCWSCVVGLQDSDLGGMPSPSDCCGTIEYIDPYDGTHPECSGSCWAGSFALDGGCVPSFTLDNGLWHITWQGTPVTDCRSELNGMTLICVTTTVPGTVPGDFPDVTLTVS